MKINITWLFVLIILNCLLINVNCRKKNRSNVIVINNTGGGGGGSTNTIVKSSGGSKKRSGYDVVLTSGGGGNKCGCGGCRPHIRTKHIPIPVYVHPQKHGHHQQAHPPKGWW